MPNQETDSWRCYCMERLVLQWTSTQRTRRSTPKGGPLTQLALGLHTVAGQNSAAVICVRAYRGGHRHRSYSTAWRPTARCERISQHPPSSCLSLSNAAVQVYMYRGTGILLVVYSEISIESTGRNVPAGTVHVYYRSSTKYMYSLHRSTMFPWVQ